MEEICSMSRCENVNGNCTETFYTFPTDIKLCSEWVERCEQPEFSEDFSYMGAYPFVKRYICSAHFTGDDFLVVGDKFSGLKLNALPVPQDPLKTTLIQVIPRPSVKQEDADLQQNCLLQVLCEQPLTKNGEEIDEKLLLKREQNAKRAAKRRSLETPEQRAERRLKDMKRAAARRQNETVWQNQIRRYNNAVRAAYRRSTESDEQRQKRRLSDTIRAARRREKESEEERTLRLKVDRERAARRRLIKKLTGSESGNVTGSFVEDCFVDAIEQNCSSVDVVS